jgi:hypothetical protein
MLVENKVKPSYFLGFQYRSWVGEMKKHGGLCLKSPSNGSTGGGLSASLALPSGTVSTSLCHLFTSYLGSCSTALISLVSILKKSIKPSMLSLKFKGNN